MLIALIRAEQYKLIRHPFNALCISLFMILSSMLFYRLSVDYFQLLQKAFASRESILVISEVVQPLCSWQIFLLGLTLPLFTTWAFSQEYKNKTVLLYMNSAHSAAKLFFSKWFALALLVLCFTLFSALMIFTLVNQSNMNWLWIGAQLFAIVCVGISFMSMGLCLSAIVSNPLITLILTYLSLFFLCTLEWLNPFGALGAPFAQTISVLSHSYRLFNGILYSPDMFYYILFNTLFIFFGIAGLRHKMSHLRL